MLCSKCGSNIPDDSKFCVRCGNKIEKVEAAEPANPPKGEEVKSPAEILCPGCGTVLNPGAKFCAKCGMKQETVAAPAQAKPAAAPVQAKPAAAPAQAKPASAPAQAKPPKKSSKKAPIAILIVILFLLLGVAVGAGCYFIAVRGMNPLENVAGALGSHKEDPDEESSESADNSKEDPEEKKGDASLLEPANKLVEEAKAEYEAGNYDEGSIPLCVEAIEQYMVVAEENDLQKEAQEGIDSVYWMYVDSIIRYCDNIKKQGANAAGFEQINGILTKAAELTEKLTEGGFSVDSAELYTYKNDVVQAFRDMYIESINAITGYENWSRDEAWNYAEQAYSIKEDGKPILFDEENLEDPLRMRYVYCLAWITRKRCETGLSDGSLSNKDVVESMEAILKETDYNLLLIQDIITYGSAAGMDVEKYRNAYNAIVEEIKNEQNFTIGSDLGVSSASSVDLRHFWYFNDLDGEDKYKVDTHNGTKAATREWIRNNVPVILGE